MNIKLVGKTKDIELAAKILINYATRHKIKVAVSKAKGIGICVKSIKFKEVKND